MSNVDVLTRCPDDVSSPKHSFSFPRFLEITATKLIQLLQEEMDILIIDLRNSESFSQGHIINAIHANCTTNPMAKRSIKHLSQLASVGRSKKIVLYNQSNRNYNEGLLKFIGNIQVDLNAFLLEGGFDSFVKQAPKEFVKCRVSTLICSPTNEEMCSEDIMSEGISEIECGIYLGNAEDSANLQLLQSIGITHILCVAGNVKMHYENLNIFHYKKIAANDSCDQNLFQYFEESYQFIENAKRDNGKILIHCVAGVSRSVTIVLSYLIRKYRMTVLGALSFVKEKRPIAAPNLNFLGQLDRYNKLLLKERSD